MATARKGQTASGDEQQSPDAATAADDNPALHEGDENPTVVEPPQRQEVPAEQIDQGAATGEGQFEGDPNTYPKSEDDLPRSY